MVLMSQTHKQKHYIKRVRKNESDAPFFRTLVPQPYVTNPCHFIEKTFYPFFKENYENSNCPIFLKEGVPTIKYKLGNNAPTFTKRMHFSQFLPRQPKIRFKLTLTCFVLIHWKTKLQRRYTKTMQVLESWCKYNHLI